MPIDPVPSARHPLAPERDSGDAANVADASLAAWLRAVLVGAIAIPALAFLLLALWGYQRAQADAEATVAHASALSLRQATRLFEIAERIARRIDAAIPADDDAVRGREKEIHERLDDMVAGLPWVVNVNVWGAGGHPLVRSDTYPVDGAPTVTDRPYFMEQRDHPVPVGIGDVIVGRQSRRELFNVTIRRETPDGRFNGVVAVSLSPESFRDYYRSLASESPNLASFALVKLDGSLIVRWPQQDDGRTHVDDDNPVIARVRAGEDSGIALVGERVRREARIISFRKAEGVPVYVTAGVGRAALLADWLHFMTLLSAIFVPITLGLAWVTWVALRKTRREQLLSLRMRAETERRAQAEKELLESQKLHALAQLTGGVAHDFNNLLTIVSNNLHILQRRFPAVGEARQVESMTRAVNSGVRLTRQLLSFSRKQALRPEIVRLQQWLPATEGLVRSVLGTRIALAYRIADDVDPILVDAAELELALVNTALNAQHAMVGEGSLTIAAANRAALAGEPARVVVSATDDGPGIPDALRSRVFEPFFTTKGIGKGSGLGLSQVAGMCEQAGGHAYADGGPGRGTSIRMVFPSAATAALEAAAVEREETTTASGTLLLVEDNDDVAAVTELLFRSAGLDVERAATADEALARLDGADGIDMVVSDIAMPGSMDGIELAFALQKRFPHLPVLLVTGFADRIDEAVRTNLRVLQKPVPPDELLREVARMLAEARVGVAA